MSIISERTSRASSLVAGAEGAALAGRIGVAVLRKAVSVLHSALVDGDAEVVREEPALGELGSAGVDGSVVTAAAAVVPGLAALGVGVLASVVLLLAGILADTGDAAAAKGLAELGVGLEVELELVAGLEVNGDVVAGNDGDLDATDGVARAVSEPPAGRLLADTGRRRRDDGDRGGGRGGLGGAREGRHGSGTGLVTLGSLLCEAVLLGAGSLALARAGAVAADVTAPGLEVHAAGRAGPSSVLQAGTDLELAAVVGLGSPQE